MFKYFLIFALFYSSFLGAADYALSPVDFERVNYLLNHSQSALVRTGLLEEKAFREATKEEVQRFLSEIGASFRVSRRSLDDMESAVLRRLRRDLEAVTRLNAELSSLSPLRDEITFSCKANRLAEIIPAAISLFEKRAHELIIGHLPAEFIGYWDRPRSLGPCDDCRENHNLLELALKACLLLTKLELEGQEHIQERVLQSIEMSAFVHSTPLPNNRIIEGVAALSFFYNGTRSPNQGELGFVHGGYAFGGQSQDVSYAHLEGPYGKRFGPQDCSSWVSKILGLKQIMSTVDFAAYYRDHMPLDQNQCLHHFVPVRVHSVSDVRPGMILVTRRFDLTIDPKKTETLGTSGHAMLVIDVDEASNSMLTLEYSRNLPEVEGFGVRRIAFEWPNDVKAMFFETAGQS